MWTVLEGAYRHMVCIIHHLAPQFYIKLVYKATVSFTLRIQIVSGSLFKVFIFISNQKFIFSHFYVKELFSVTINILKKDKKNAHEKMKK